METTTRQVRNSSGNRGFTLVELMIVILISGLITTALYSAYVTQQRSQTAQDQVVEMQQQLRSGFNFLQREIRMAGFDPQGTSPAAIVTATRSRFSFTQDNNPIVAPAVYPGDGDVADAGETVTYFLSNDANNDGVADAGISSLQRLASGLAASQPVADNIEAIELLYLIGNDSTPSLTPAAAEFSSIHTVVISMLARTRFPDPQFRGGMNFRPASNDPSFHNGDYNINSGAVWGANDNFRRRLLVATVQLRNMGL